MPWLHDAAAVGGDEGALMNVASHQSEQDDLLMLADFSPHVLELGDFVDASRMAALSTPAEFQCHTKHLCWGSELHGEVLLHCDAHFRISGSHLKDKFCSKCREDGVLIPASRVRALRPDQHETFTNSSGGGLWNDNSFVSNMPDYRVINHVHGCKGPRLVRRRAISKTALHAQPQHTLALCSHPVLQVIFRTQPPPMDTTWATLPPAWADGEHVRLWASKGTLVPSRPRTRPYLSRSGSTLHSAKRQQTTHGGPDAIVSSRLSPQPSSSSSPSNVPPFHDNVESGDADRLGGSVADGSVAGGGNDRHLTPPPFSERYVAAHMDLKALIEERLHSAEPMPIEQRETLTEQVRATEKGGGGTERTEKQGERERGREGGRVEEWKSGWDGDEQARV